MILLEISTKEKEPYILNYTHQNSGNGRAISTAATQAKTHASNEHNSNLESTIKKLDSSLQMKP
ncbi:hypothetical protein GCM10022216_10730 [Sphingobacterium kyonggiense]|uniref:Uncharacterized protein n=1 Tax=Sphingobacterium kyonggiense TaxID=714075 RepID=A0ABP7YHI2_9SPHI